MKKIIFPVFCAILCLMASCNEKKAAVDDTTLIEEKNKSKKIVSLNGSITEIICLAGHEKDIVGVDVTSTFPESINKIAKVGHSRSLSAEGIIALNPELVLGKEDEIKPEMADQLKKAGIEVKLFKHDYTVDGTLHLIEEVCETVDNKEAAKKIITELEADLKTITALDKKPTVLFIYARGAGTLMVAGEDTPVEKMITLAGGQNAAKGFSDFKPLTPEALLEANPEVILMFTSGIESIEGEEGLMKLPGVAKTKAGQTKRFVYMDGQLLSGFGPRLGKAAKELNTYLQANSKTALK